MTFERSWMLLVAVLPLLWAAYEWSHTRRHLGLILRALSFVAILVAMAEPRLVVDETKLAVAVLADTSASATEADLERASALARTIVNESGRHWSTVIPFARQTRKLAEGELSDQEELQPTPGDAGRGTNLEAAIQEAIAALPEAMVPRIVLITDGKETEGSLSRASWQAKQLDIPIDTFLLPGRREPELKLDSVSLPSLAYAGEQFPIDVAISSPSAGSATMELAAEGVVLGQSQVALKAGANAVRMHTSLNTPGALDLTVKVHSDQLGDLQYEQAMVVRQPKVLYFSNDSRAEDEHLTSALNSARFEVTAARSLAGLRLNDYQLVIFNNWDLEHLSDTAKKDIASYVRLGGGLLVVAGDRNVYVERPPGTPEDALQAALPAKLAPPRSPEGTAVVLIVDKSSSMEGRKMELARLASIGVVENLRPIDQVGVLMFDNTFEWAVPIRKAEDKPLISRLIAGIMPDGGTQIAPALAEAYNRLVPVKASYRHIVLLTDGISEEGNSLLVARSAKENEVSISTVGLGQDVNRNYLERVAENAGGSSYIVTDLQQLERILIKDVLEHTGSTTVESSLSPQVSKRVEILDGVNMTGAPQLKGYVRFDAKPSAETILTINGEGEDDPLLTRWQYGLGRADVFASDAKPRWAANWISWPGYDKFWTNIARDLLPHTQRGETSVEFDSANRELVVSYLLDRTVAEPANVPRIFVFGPEGFQAPLEVKKIATGTYQGLIEIGDLQGLFRVLPAQESAAFPETGLYRPEAELERYGSNASLLRQVSAFTGGRFEPEPEDVFQGTGKSIGTYLNLWPGLLAAAIALSLAELVMRKWKGIAAQ